MNAWQFWTLIGVFVFMQANIWALLSMIRQDLHWARRHLFHTEEETRALVGIQAAMSNDVATIKSRAQRD
jgi:hypothetical protein